jgi:hypothetical protein
MSELFSEQTEIVSRYSRIEAIEYGVLVDMTQEPFGSLAREAGIIWPIAMTATAFSAFVEVSNTVGHSSQNVKGPVVGRRLDVSADPARNLSTRGALEARGPRPRRPPPAKGVEVHQRTCRRWLSLPDVHASK